MKIRKLSLKKILFHDVNFTKFLEYLILFFFSIKPDYFSELGSIATLYNLGVFAVTAYLVLKLIRKRNLSIVSILVIGITLFPMLVSIFMDVEMTMSMFIFPAQTINLTLIIALGTDKWFREMLFAFTLILEIYVYVNFFSIILFPAGLIESDLYSGMYWFLGYKNVMIRFLLPAVFLKAIMCVYVAGRYTIGFYLVYIITFATQIITDCKTGLLGVGIIGIMLYFFSYNRMPKWLNLRNACIVIFGVSLLITNTGIVNIFVDYLQAMGEEASVMSRTYVWERSVQMFKESPIWGYGFRSNEGYRRLINLNLGWGYFSHPHNYVLYVLMQGGVTLAGLIIALMLIISKKCIKMRTHFGAKILVFIYIAFFVMGISEALTAFTMLYPLAIFVDAFEKYEMEYRKRPRVKFKLR